MQWHWFNLLVGVCLVLFVPVLWWCFLCPQLFPCDTRCSFGFLGISWKASDSTLRYFLHLFLNAESYQLHLLGMQREMPLVGHFLTSVRWNDETWCENSPNSFCWLGFWIKLQILIWFFSLFAGDVERANLFFYPSLIQMALPQREFNQSLDFSNAFSSGQNCRSKCSRRTFWVTGYRLQLSHVAFDMQRC